MANQKETIFTGAATALITPMINGGVDYKKLGELIEFQIANKIDGLVSCGTTGEASTLTDEEHRECIRFTVEKTAGRVPVIAGTGSNDTDYAISLSKYACEAGADGLLLVTPYYNKATPKGLIQSFLAVANVTNKPIILYNVPTRTGVNIPISVYKELAKHERIVATKEASGNISAIAQIAAETDLDIYSGNDDQIVPILSLGAKGVISVLSNIMPESTHDICNLWFANKQKESLNLQLQLLELINTLFIEVNPMPIKAACALMNLSSTEIRLPLCEIEESTKTKLIQEMKKARLI
jgi:dihydrodipicolinate synthase